MPIEFLTSLNKSVFNGKNFYLILQKKFIYSKRRVEFEKSQRKFYNSARSKLYGTPTFTMQDKKKLLFPEEQDVINYFTS